MLRLGAAHGRAEQEARIAALCGEEFLEHARHFRREIEGLRVEGWLAAPAFSRSQPDMQYHVRESPLRARQTAASRRAPRLSRRAVSSAPTGVRRVLGARPAPRRCERASREARDSLPRFEARARVRVSHGRGRAREHAGIRRQTTLGRPCLARRSRRARSFARRPRRCSKSRSRYILTKCASTCRSTNVCTRERPSPSPRTPRSRRSATRSRSSRGSTCSPRTTTASSSSTCTPRTNASRTSG